MDGCSQMVFCTHLSDTADRERVKKGEERVKVRKEKEKQQQEKVFIDRKSLYTAA